MIYSSYLEDELGLPVLNDESVENLGQTFLELDVDDGTDDGDDLTAGQLGGRGRRSSILTVLLKQLYED